ncbi:FkbM family methyltransferase [Halioglobus pacificus]|uniref:Methyltransferase FkbM domain-containing protein n=1 Tax=Parahalioglobus pacificus TaxID=930806 RepID=A0A918XII7_9GAMM|nr:FkbM family methyltransferase [Halioglobus pacificus]GHD33732.1 hypothetical protein GCM10007053_18500 [Halioglobus pacificus]
MIKRLADTVKLILIALRYLVARRDSGQTISEFLVSDAVGVRERGAVASALVKLELESLSIHGDRDAPKVTVKQFGYVLQEVNNIGYLQRGKVSMTRDTWSGLLRIYHTLNQADYQELNRLIDKLQNEYFCDDIVPQDAYAQEGEDLIVARLNRNSTGFFVDIGAHHPTRFSNTYKLYERGWRGINIDPLPGGMQAFENLRPKDINLEVAISDNEEPGSLTYYMFDEPAFNSLEERNITDATALGAKLIAEVKVPVMTIESLLGERSGEFEKIDLLTVDVEHHELRILQSFPFHLYKPSNIVVEIKGLDLLKPDCNPVYRCLSEQGYRLRSYLYHSAIFVHDGPAL